MSKVISVSYRRETSVRITQYQYIKPTIEMTATVDEGEEYEDVYQAVKFAVKERLKQDEAEILAQYGKKGS